MPFVDRVHTAFSRDAGALAWIILLPLGMEVSMRHVLLVALLCAVASSASAANLIVPSATHPTIGAAVGAANPGDVVIIKAGTYAETIDISNTLGLSIIGKGKVIIDAAGNMNGIVATNFTFNRIENITIRNPQARGVDLTGGGASLLRKVRVENAGTDGIKLASCDAIQLVQCTAVGCDGDGFDLFATSTLVSKCVARLNQFVGIRIDGNRNRVVACTIESADQFGLSMGLDAISTANSVANLKIKGENGTGIILGALADSNSFIDVIISSCTSAGCSVANGSNGNSFRKMSVKDTGTVGIQISGDTNVLDTCSAFKSAGEGFLLLANANENLLVNCTAKACPIGYSLAGDDNTVMRSKALQCATTANEVGTPANHYVDNNFPDPDTF